jgi:choline kinase
MGRRYTLVTTAVILAAGRGTRLGALTQLTPKCLLKIGQRTILEHMVSVLNECTMASVLLVMGTKGDCWNQKSYEIVNNICKKNGVKLILNFENDRTESSYSLFLAMNEIKKTSLLAMDGDVFLSRRVLDSICNASYDTFVLSKRINDLSAPGTRIITDQDKRVADVGKNIIPNASFWYIYSGVIKIGEKYFGQFKETLSKRKYKPLDISHPLREFSQKCELYNLETNDGWININTLEELEKARQLWRI